MYNPAMKLFVTARPNVGKHSPDRVVRVKRVRKSRCDSRDGCEPCASRPVGRRGPGRERHAIQRAYACGADLRERFRCMGWGRFPARPGLPAARTRSFCSVPERQKRKASTRRNAAGCAKIGVKDGDTSRSRPVHADGEAFCARPRYNNHPTGGG